MTRSDDTVNSLVPDDQLADLFAAVTVDGAPSSTAAPNPTVLFSSVGTNEGDKASSLPPKGNSELYSVVCFTSDADIHNVCGGFIGGDTLSFCLKPASHSRL